MSASLPPGAARASPDGAPRAPASPGPPPRPPSGVRRPSAEDQAFVRSLLVYEDETLLAFAKPAGLVSQGARGGRPALEDLLSTFQKSNGKRPSLVHRLDKDTSGIILAARTKPALAFFGKALQARRVVKTYLALVERAPEPASGRIEAPLRRDESGREAAMRVCESEHPDAEPALTLYRTLAEGRGAALLELSPRTGRMHQLRAHLEHVGRPILGDPRYGGRMVAAGEPAPRLMLHAYAVETPLPTGGRRRLHAPAPEDFRRLAERAGLDVAAAERALEAKAAAHAERVERAARAAPRGPPEADLAGPGPEGQGPAAAAQEARDGGGEDA